MNLISKDSLLTWIMGVFIGVIVIHAYVAHQVENPVLGHVQLELVGVTQYENSGETFYVPLYRRKK